MNQPDSREIDLAALAAAWTDDPPRVGDRVRVIDESVGLDEVLTVVDVWPKTEVP